MNLRTYTKRYISLVIGVIVALTAAAPAFAFAQSAAPSPALPSARQMVDTYCAVGPAAVQVIMDKGASGASSGTDYPVSGIVRDNASFPISDLSIVARVRKLPNASALGYAATSDIVQRFTAADGLAVASGQSVRFSFPWHVPAGIASGSYALDLYLVSGGTLALKGSENNSVPAASVIIPSVGGKAAAGVSYIDTQSVTVAGKELGVSTSTTLRLAVTKDGSAVPVSFDILNTYTTARTITAKMTIYGSTVMSDKTAVYSDSRQVTLQPGMKATVSFTAPQTSDTVRNILIETIDGDKSSLYSFWSAMPHGTFVSATLFGLDAYPSAAPGATTNIFGCLSSNATSTVEIDAYVPGGASFPFSEERVVPGVSMFVVPVVFKDGLAGPGIGLSLVEPAKDGVPRQIATVQYLCSSFCPARAGAGAGGSIGILPYYIYLAVGLVGIIVCLIILRRLKHHENS